MPEKKKMWIVTAMVVLCSGAMLWVDGVLRPPYAVKSAIKVALFLACPLLYARIDGSWSARALFRFEKTGLKRAAALGVSVFVVILSAYFFLRRWVDFSIITPLLGENVGVTGENFLYVALYISFVNSLLEEFFFRGFAFLTLRQSAGCAFAYVFSALAFAVYHTAMMLGWFSLPIFLLALFGLAVGGALFDLLNERSGTIYPSWTVHACANFAINTVGMILFGILCWLRRKREDFFLLFSKKLLQFANLYDKLLGYSARDVDFLSVPTWLAGGMRHLEVKLNLKEKLKQWQTSYP